jgi:murein DD-endopeptidase
MNLVAPLATPGMEVNVRTTWAQCWMKLAWCVGVFVLATGLAEGQQIGRTPIEVRVPQPPSPATALGRTHLVYEVHLTNFGSEAVRVERLDVLDSGGGTLASWQGAQLWQRISILGRVHDNSAVQTLAPGARAIAYLWVSLSAAQSTPSAVAHRLTLSHGTEDRDTFTAAQVPVMEPGPSLAAPVRGGPWLAARGPSNSSPHRLSIVAMTGAARVPQRFAVDWALLGEDGRLFHDAPTVLTNWYGYAAPVYAAANGVVALVREGVPDRIPLDASSAPIIQATEAPGNVIVLDLGHGRFATYAHLKVGSVRVAPGDHVVAGQMLAQIGNSGNTKAPHLHFQISGDVEPLAGEGLPFSLESFMLIGRVPGLAALLNGGQWTPNAAQPSRAVTGEMPLEDMVVRFVSEPSRQTR